MCVWQSKIMVNKSSLINSPKSPKSLKNSSAAYVTFATAEAAAKAIACVDMYTFDSRLLRASFGTSKYCNSFLRGSGCGNPECLYLHEMGQEEDSFSKEQIQQGLANRTGEVKKMEHLVGDQAANFTGFPPPSEGLPQVSPTGAANATASAAASAATNAANSEEETTVSSSTSTSPTPADVNVTVPPTKLSFASVAAKSAPVAFIPPHNPHAHAAHLPPHLPPHANVPPSPPLTYRVTHTPPIAPISPPQPDPRVFLPRQHVPPPLPALPRPRRQHGSQRELGRQHEHGKHEHEQHEHEWDPESRSVQVRARANRASETSIALRRSQPVHSPCAHSLNLNSPPLP